LNRCIQKKAEQFLHFGITPLNLKNRIHPKNPNERVNQMKKTLLFLTALFLLLLPGCGKIKQAKNIVNSVSDMASAGEESEADSDWGMADLSEKDIRKFYSGVNHLNEKYPEVEFEVAVTAALAAMTEGIDLEKVVEKETDMNFDEYNGLSAAILMAETEAAGLEFVVNMVAGMEAGLDEYEAIDLTALGQEERAAAEEAAAELRSDLAEAKAEIESPEFREKYEKAMLVLSIREEMGR